MIRQACPSADQPGTIETGYVLARVPKLTKRQVDYWVREGFVHPEVSTPGQGRTRRWAAREVRVLQYMGMLVRAGFEPWKASYIAHHAEAQELPPGRPAHVQVMEIVVSLPKLGT